MTQDEFLQQHGADLTAEQAAQLLELGDMGDTGTPPDEGSEPDAAPEQNDDTTTVATDDDKGEPGSEDPANTVVLTRDRKHTIDYQVLADERAGRKQERESRIEWQAKAEAALVELETLRAEAQKRADAGAAPTVADVNLAIAEDAIANGANPEIFGDFSEEALAKGIRTVAREEALAVVRAEMEQALRPMKQKQEADATEAHFNAIYEKHPDADSLVKSKELADWIASQPSFARAGFEAVLKQGTASEVVEMFDAFKSSTGRTQPAAAAQDLRARAKAAVANAKPSVPASLSDIPGGTPGPASKFEALAQLEPAELAERLESMSPKDRDAWLEHQM